MYYIRRACVLPGQFPRSSGRPSRRSRACSPRAVFWRLETREQEFRRQAGAGIARRCAGQRRRCRPRDSGATPMRTARTQSRAYGSRGMVCSRRARPVRTLLGPRRRRAGRPSSCRQPLTRRWLAPPTVRATARRTSRSGSAARFSETSAAQRERRLEPKSDRRAGHRGSLRKQLPHKLPCTRGDEEDRKGAVHNVPSRVGIWASFISERSAQAVPVPVPPRV